MPKKGLKVGKDVLNKKSSGILTVKEREALEKWKAQKLAEDLAKEEKDEEKEQELHGKKITSKMIEDREPTIPTGLTEEERQVLRQLKKQRQKKPKPKVKVEVT